MDNFMNRETDVVCSMLRDKGTQIYDCGVVRKGYDLLERSSWKEGYQLCNHQRSYIYIVKDQYQPQYLIQKQKSYPLAIPSTSE